MAAVLSFVRKFFGKEYIAEMKVFKKFHFLFTFFID